MPLCPVCCLLHVCVAFPCVGVGKILCVNFLQNVAVTYGGMLLYHDYVYEPYNFAGINLRLVGLSTLHTCSYYPPPPTSLFQCSGELVVFIYQVQREQLDRATSHQCSTKHRKIREIKANCLVFYSITVYV